MRLIDESQLREHVFEVVRKSVGQTLNGLLDAEAEVCDYGLEEYTQCTEAAASAV